MEIKIWMEKNNVCVDPNLSHPNVAPPELLGEKKTNSWAPSALDFPPSDVQSCFFFQPRKSHGFLRCFLVVFFRISPKKNSNQLKVGAKNIQKFPFFELLKRRITTELVRLFSQCFCLGPRLRKVLLTSLGGVLLWRNIHILYS